MTAFGKMNLIARVRSCRCEAIAGIDNSHAIGAILPMDASAQSTRASGVIRAGAITE